MQKNPEWNDLRVFLTVARLGTISKAGEKLGIEHSTVSRRIDRLEASLDVVLFDRRRSGYTLTDAGTLMIPYAEKMESALLEGIEESGDQNEVIEGSVRVGTPEAFGIHVLAPNLVELQKEHPRLHVELMAQIQFPSLVSREVEILVTLEPPQSGRYKIARLAQIEYYLYYSTKYRDSHPPIRQLSDIEHHQFVDYVHEGYVSERYQILKELLPNPARCFSTTSVLAQQAAAASGIGLVLLTPYVASRNPELVSVFPDKPLLTRSLWIAAPEDLLRLKRVRHVWNFIRRLIDRQPEHFHRNAP
jgi:DNA-binding transcriptional LysR family regulator